MAAEWKLPEGWAVKLGKDGRLIKAGPRPRRNLAQCDTWPSTEKHQERMERDGTSIMSMS